MPTNNNPYISQGNPIVDGEDKVFARSWFRFFDMLSKKIRILDGTQTTSATAGVATALPVQPAGYMTIIGQDGNTYKVPYYNA